MHLHENTAKTPHINGHVIRNTEQNFWRTIESTLDVLIKLRKGREGQWDFHSNLMIKNHTRWPIWHELPKSTILIADLLGLTKRMFSGFRSRRMTRSFTRPTTWCHLPQWRTLRSGWERNRSAERSCSANFRVRFNETPRKFVLRNRSYRLYDSNSKTRHRWFRKVKFRFNFTRKRTHPKVSSRVRRNPSNLPI